MWREQHFWNDTAQKSSYDDTSGYTLHIKPYQNRNMDQEEMCKYLPKYFRGL
jgi:hypothetical protein